jgi:hypothetical protein
MKRIILALLAFAIVVAPAFAWRKAINYDLSPTADNAYYLGLDGYRWAKIWGREMDIYTTRTDGGSIVVNRIATAFAPTYYSSNSLTNADIYASYAVSCSTSNVQGAHIYSYITGDAWIGQTWGAKSSVYYGNTYNAVSPGNSVYAHGFFMNLFGDGGNPSHGMHAKFNIPSRTGTTQFDNWYCMYIDNQGGYGASENYGIFFAYPGQANGVAWGDSGASGRSYIYADNDSRVIVADPDSAFKIIGLALADTANITRIFATTIGNDDNYVSSVYSLNGKIYYVFPGGASVGGVGLEGSPYAYCYYDTIHANVNIHTADTLKPICIGDPNTDGSWRLIGSGDNLVIQRRESSTWTTKSTITP